MSVGDNYDVIVLFDVLIEHLSVGNFDENWLSETFHLHKKWNKKLPQKNISLTKKEICDLEYSAWFDLTYYLVKHKNKRNILLSILFSPRLFKILGIKYWPIFQYKILSKAVMNRLK